MRYASEGVYDCVLTQALPASGKKLVRKCAPAAVCAGPTHARATIAVGDLLDDGGVSARGERRWAKYRSLHGWFARGALVPGIEVSARFHDGDAYIGPYVAERHAASASGKLGQLATKTVAAFRDATEEPAHEPPTAEQVDAALRRLRDALAPFGVNPP